MTKKHLTEKERREEYYKSKATELNSLLKYLKNIKIKEKDKSK